jgi:hypothetical protein
MNSQLTEDLMRFHINKIIKKNECKDDINTFITEHLNREERFITLNEYLNLIPSSKDIYESSAKIYKQFTLKRNDKILPLYYIQTPDIQQKGEKEDTVFFYSIILNNKNDLLLLKCSITGDKLTYYVMRLDLYEDKPFQEEAFMIAVLPEFLSLVQDIETAPKLYALKKELFRHVVKYITHYSKYNEITIIKNAILNNNMEHSDLNIVREGEKLLEISYGNTKKIIQFFDSPIKPIKKTYRTRNYPKYNERIDGFIVKAVEPDNNKSHYIYVSFEKNKKGERIVKFDRKRRLNINPLFKLDRNGYQFISDRNSYPDNGLIYSSLINVKL